MAIAFNPDDKMISIRRGDSGMLSFKFKQDVRGLKATFAVKKHDDDFEDEAVIVKQYVCGSDSSLDENTAYISLTGYDTEVLDIIPKRATDKYQDYVWMLNLSDGIKSVSDTIIPNEFDNFPVFRVYLGSVD